MAGQIGRHQSVLEALWRTPVGNRTLSKNLDPQALVTSAAAAGEQLEKYHPNPKLLDADYDVTPEEQKRMLPMASFMHLARRCWAGRRVCVTRKGLIGAVPAAAREGDDVVVFGGMAAPAVLRRLPDGEDTGDGENFVGGDCEDVVSAGATRRRVYVGECYVHGIMDGEALTQAGCRSLSWFEPSIDV